VAKNCSRRFACCKRAFNIRVLFFSRALRDILESQEIGMSAVSKKTKLNRENLYRMLSLRGNPKISSIVPVLQALGLQLSVQPCKKK
jgi:probable addiction module antidote protein